jgi:hypothetical protein
MLDEKPPHVVRRLNMLRDRARARATADRTGASNSGRIIVAYYPRCARYGWWVDGDRCSMDRAAAALMGER